MTLGQEFHGFATTLGEDIARLRETIKLLSEVNLGATAIGTGITADPGYASAVVRHLSEITGLAPRDGARPHRGHERHRRVHDVLECRSSAAPSSSRRSATTCACSPPARRRVSARSTSRRARPARRSCRARSIPVIPEVVNQVAFAVAGADVTVTMAAESGQLQLNAFEPVIAHSLLQSITWMRQACWTLRVNCVDGITANRELLAAQVASSVGVITALTPFIGYTEASTLAKQRARHGAPRSPTSSSRRAS